MPPFFWLRLGRYALELLYAFAISTIFFGLALPHVTYLLALTHLARADYNPNDQFPTTWPVTPDWSWVPWLLQFMGYVYMSGELLGLIRSYDKCTEAWERARAISNEAERRAELRVEAADRYIAEAKEAHHKMCSDMMERVCSQQRVLRVAKASFRTEQEMTFKKAQRVARQRYQSV